MLLQLVWGLHLDSHSSGYPAHPFGSGSLPFHPWAVFLQTYPSRELRLLPNLSSFPTEPQFYQEQQHTQFREHCIFRLLSATGVHMTQFYQWKVSGLPGSHFWENSLKGVGWLLLCWCLPSTSLSITNFPFSFPFFSGMWAWCLRRFGHQGTTSDKQMLRMLEWTKVPGSLIT